MTPFPDPDDPDPPQEASTTWIDRLLTPLYFDPIVGVSYFAHRDTVTP